jgi:hypothetical protein
MEAFRSASPSRSITASRRPPGDFESFFLKNGWTRLKDPSGHVIFFNHAFHVLAIDAERRNCYLTDGQLQPFDVILCRPDAAMEEFLGIWPRP